MTTINDEYVTFHGFSQDLTEWMNKRSQEGYKFLSMSAAEYRITVIMFKTIRV